MEEAKYRSEPKEFGAGIASFHPNAFERMFSCFARAAVELMDNSYAIRERFNATRVRFQLLPHNNPDDAVLCLWDNGFGINPNRPEELVHFGHPDDNKPPADSKINMFGTGGTKAARYFKDTYLFTMHVDYPEHFCIMRIGTRFDAAMKVFMQSGHQLVDLLRQDGYTGAVCGYLSHLIKRSTLDGCLKCLDDGMADEDLWAKFMFDRWKARDANANVNRLEQIKLFFSPPQSTANAGEADFVPLIKCPASVRDILEAYRKLRDGGGHGLLLQFYGLAMGSANERTQQQQLDGKEKVARTADVPAARAQLVLQHNAALGGQQDIFDNKGNVFLSSYLSELYFPRQAVDGELKTSSLGAAGSSCDPLQPVANNNVRWQCPVPGFLPDDYYCDYHGFEIQVQGARITPDIALGCDPMTSEHPFYSLRRPIRLRGEQEHVSSVYKDEGLGAKVVFLLFEVGDERERGRALSRKAESGVTYLWHDRALNYDKPKPLFSEDKVVTPLRAENNTTVTKRVYEAMMDGAGLSYDSNILSRAQFKAWEKYQRWPAVGVGVRAWVTLTKQELVGQEKNGLEPELEEPVLRWVRQKLLQFVVEYWQHAGAQNGRVQSKPAAKTKPVSSVQRRKRSSSSSAAEDSDSDDDNAEDDEDFVVRNAPLQNQQNAINRRSGCKRACVRNSDQQHAGVAQVSDEQDSASDTSAASTDSVDELHLQSAHVARKTKQQQPRRAQPYARKMQGLQTCSKKAAATAADALDMPIKLIGADGSADRATTLREELQKVENGLVIVCRPQKPKDELKWAMMLGCFNALHDMIKAHGYEVFGLSTGALKTQVLYKKRLTTSFGVDLEFPLIADANPNNKLMDALDAKNVKYSYIMLNKQGERHARGKCEALESCRKVAAEMGLTDIEQRLCEFAARIDTTVASKAACIAAQTHSIQQPPVQNPMLPAPSPSTPPQQQPQRVAECGSLIPHTGCVAAAAGNRGSDGGTELHRIAAGGAAHQVEDQACEHAAVLQGDMGANKDCAGCRSMYACLMRVRAACAECVPHDTLVQMIDDMLPACETSFDVGAPATVTAD